MLSLAVEAINSTNFYGPKVYLPRLLSNYFKVSVVGPLPNTFARLFYLLLLFIFLPVTGIGSVFERGG